ncbi:dsDNA nuclease domain-containing protein [Saccharopolyspora hattusasensis]|uniref:dsDNA nuclease domain-containing protein n=1 Tax=Saccharopolyspora hattusasensis TaxID=1128679 RepID=UPI003D9942FB
MGDPLDIAAPDDSGSATLRRFTYQEHVAGRSVLAMLAEGASVQFVICEHIEDVVVGRLLNGDMLWDFQQVKTRDNPAPWGLTEVLSSKALKSLWRTHETLDGQNLCYQLTASLEGKLDPADDALAHLARGAGAEHEKCLARVAAHLKAPLEKVKSYLRLVRVEALPTRGSLEEKSLLALSELAPQVTSAVQRAVYEAVLTRIHEAMQGALGPDWLRRLGLEPDGVFDNKRISRASIADLAQRLQHPDHVLLSAYTERIETIETKLVHKMRAGGASPDTIQEAQYLRAEADYRRLQEESLGTWPGRETADDLDTRLLLMARRIVRRHNATIDRPADQIFDELATELNANAHMLDARSLYAKDGLLLLGRACAKSDECHFAWGNANDTV